MKLKQKKLLLTFVPVLLLIFLPVILGEDNNDPMKPVFSLVIDETAKTSPDGDSGYQIHMEADYELSKSWYQGPGIFARVNWSDYPATPAKMLTERGSILQMRPGETLPFVMKNPKGSGNGWNGSEKHTYNKFIRTGDTPSALLVRTVKGGKLYVNIPLMSDNGEGYLHTFNDLNELIIQYELTEEELSTCTKSFSRSIDNQEYVCSGKVKAGLDANLNGYTVKIVKPAAEREFVYGEFEDNNIYISVKAEATPNKFDDRIKGWEAEPTGGSELEIKKLVGPDEVNENPPKGPKVIVRYKNLPSLNGEFGPKKIECDNADPVRVKLFFDPRGTDNPDKKEANWYYYWKQGCVPGLEKFSYTKEATYYGLFIPPNHLRIAEGAIISQAPYNIILYTHKNGKRVPVSKVHLGGYKGADRIHGVVLHEMRHQEFYKMCQQKGVKDTDLDGVPDFYEKLSDFYLNPYMADTHDLAGQLDPCYLTYGDNELISRLQENKPAPKANLDWAAPGKQSSKPNPY